MNAERTMRGSGVGIEVVGKVVRGLHLVPDPDDPVRTAAEAPVRAPDEDRSMLDALVRLRADLAHPQAPTRVALFAPASLFRRIDVTGATGVELAETRSRLDHDHGIASTVLLDDGPRRWLVAIRWSSSTARRLEELAERAGFVDVAIDPSPVALARVLGRDVHRARLAGPNGGFDLLLRDGVPVAAAATGPRGDLPHLAQSVTAFPSGWFDDLTAPSDLVREIGSMVDESAPDDTVTVAGWSYPQFPAHDLRAPARVCVALGAAVGAAGLAGRLRPVDVVDAPATAVGSLEYPWVVERLSDLPDTTTTTIGPVKRFVASVLPRRRRR